MPARPAAPAASQRSNRGQAGASMPMPARPPLRVTSRVRARILSPPATVGSDPRA